MTMRFSQACENNKQPILQQLKLHFAPVTKVLEIGSGTGQHGVFFAPQLSHLNWQTSDMPDNHTGILAWQEQFPADNLLPPVNFTVGADPWPDMQIDAVFSANTAHIMQIQEARLMMQMVAANLPRGGVFCQYGPFNVNGQYTSESNERFDLHLSNEGCGGIRDIAELQDWAAGMTLTEKVTMPANNFLLVWKKD